MKNRFTAVFALFLILFVAIGCGLMGSNETESGEPTGSGDKKGTKEAEPSGDVVLIGIQECDELATFINDNSEEIEGSYLLQGIVYIYKNYILENIREGVAKMSDEEKAKAARVCTKTMEDLKKNMKK